MKKYSMHIIQRKSEIHVCACGIRYLEIQAEIDIGYKRQCCPWCECYKTGRKTPPLTHLGVPRNLEEFRSMIYKD